MFSRHSKDEMRFEWLAPRSVANDVFNSVTSLAQRIYKWGGRPARMALRSLSEFLVSSQLKAVISMWWVVNGSVGWLAAKVATGNGSPRSYCGFGGWIAFWPTACSTSFVCATRMRTLCTTSPVVPRIFMRSS
eukprot:6698411-Lingulodinium_polyedra.AAC.1